MHTSRYGDFDCRARLGKLLALLLAFVLLGPPVRAMDGPPTPLADLAGAAGLVLVGRVVAIDPELAPPNEYGMTYSIAILSVEEVLKGERCSESVRVRYPSNMACPPPPAFALERLFLVFLNGDPATGEFTTCNGDDGAKWLCSDESRDAYVVRTREILEILRISDISERRRQTADWLVRCAERKPTAWEGAYELSGQSRWHTASPERLESAAQLTSAQKDRLFAALLTYSEKDPEAMCLASAVAAAKDGRAMEFFVKAFELAAADPSPCPAVSPAHYMRVLGELLDWPDGIALADDYYRLEKHTSQREIQNLFRAGLAKRVNAALIPRTSRASASRGAKHRRTSRTVGMVPWRDTSEARVKLRAPEASLPIEAVSFFEHENYGEDVTSLWDMEDQSTFLLTPPFDNQSVDSVQIHTENWAGLKTTVRRPSKVQSNAAEEARRVRIDTGVAYCLLP
jgi:hypothetical protein